MEIKEILKDFTTSYGMIKNEELNGIELYFDSIPPQKERDILKANKFKWHSQKKCWYKKLDTEETTTETTKKETKKQNELQLKSIRMATPEEVEEIVKEQWKDEHMQKFLKESYNFYMLQDGYYLEIEKTNKLSIAKTMWYDDETEGPSVNEANFILYNMQLHNPARTLDDYLENKENLEKNGCATGLYDYNGLYIVCYYKFEKRADIHCYYEKDEKVFKRYLTQEEQEDYINILKDLKERYIERLKKYFKKYGQHVHASGYWVNR